MNKFFAAANSADGFVCRFEDIFSADAVDYTYIIKGGSGTGKSTLMKNAAARATSLGGEVEYFYCSSDPSSLDGIIMTLSGGRKIAMLDGTAPHTYDPKIPGVLDEIINLGGFWNGDILKKAKPQIVRLASEKSHLFKEAYKDFSVAGTLMRRLVSRAGDFTDKEKLDGAMRRLLEKRMREVKFNPKKHQQSKKVRFLSALSTDGEMYFDSFADSQMILTVCDTAFSWVLAFDSLIRTADSLGLSYEYAPMPLVTEFCEGIRFPSLSLSIVSRTDAMTHGVINMCRFVDKAALSASDRKRCREIYKGMSRFIDLGLAKLARVKNVHGELERLYGSAMDFDRLSRECDELIKNILA